MVIIGPVTGASRGVGTYLIQLLKMFGAHVEALASPPNFDFLKKLGVDDLVDYSADVTTQLANLPHANKVIDTVGRLDLLEAIIAATRHFDLLSLSTTTFPEHTQDQTFRFANGSIGLNGYKTGSAMGHFRRTSRQSYLSSRSNKRSIN
ncbi:hypothetical protein LCA02_02190 [Lacticaseibacillus casei]|nr:hypothetical protein LCA02_02190 [Lacticaseibacillus casei]